MAHFSQLLLLLTCVFALPLATAGSGDPGDSVEPDTFRELVPLVSGKADPIGIPGHGTVIQFWASWCHSCTSLMWDLDRIVSGSAGARHLMVALDTGRDEALRTLGEHPLAERLLPRTYLDPDGQMSARLGVSAVPTVIVVDRYGAISWRGQGHLNSRDFNQIRSELASAAPP